MKPLNLHVEHVAKANSYIFPSWLHPLLDFKFVGTRTELSPMSCDFTESQTVSDVVIRCKVPYSYFNTLHFILPQPKPKTKSKPDSTYDNEVATHDLRHSPRKLQQ